MKIQAANEYKRRGCPAMTTRWDVGTIARWQRFKLASVEDGDDFGAYAHLLPAAQGKMPAPLPHDLLEWEAEFGADAGVPAAVPNTKGGGKGAKGQSKGKGKRKAEKAETAGVEIPESGYTLAWNEDHASWVLNHEKAGMVPLPKPSANYIIYKDDSGRDVVWSQIQKDRPQYCQQIFEENKATKPSSMTSIVPTASAAAALRGMKPGTHPAPRIEMSTPDKMSHLDLPAGASVTTTLRVPCYWGD